VGNRYGWTSLPALFGKSVLSLCGGLNPALAGLAALLFLVGVVPQQAAHAGIGYAVSLIVVLGAAGCLGGLLLLFSRGLPLRPSGLLKASPPTTRRTGVRGENWPLLVALLFGPFFVLLAGLGGWV
jgi:hypothetical protein